MASASRSRRPTAFFVDADCHPQTIALIETRAEPLGWTRRSSAIPSPISTRSTVFGAIFQYPGTYGHVHDFTGLIAAPARRPARIAVVAADPLALTLLKSPGEMGADIAVGSIAALRRAGRLRRPACRLHGGQGRAQALDARPPRRRLGRCPRQPRLPPVAADPRAAYPPRKGDVEHLHRAGAARRHGLDVRGLPRPARASRRSPSASTRRPCGWPRAWRSSASPSSPSTFFDTITVEVGTLQGVILRAAVAEGRQPAQGRRRPRSASPSTSAPARRRWKPSGAPSAATSRARRLRAATTACPKACCAPAPT